MRLIILILSLWLFTAFGAEKINPPDIVKIDQAQMSDQRLPCNQGQKKFCDLRIYQIMVGSFVDGDPQRGFGSGYGPSRYRGDLRGVINALDYIRSLNVNAIWLTPIFDTDADHDTGDQLRLAGTGYFAHDFFKVDPHFGTLADLKELVQKAHQHGMYIFLDGVFGHAKITGVKPSPSGLTPTLKVCQGKEYTGYPGLCAQYPQSRDFFAEVATYWMREAGIDGWRVDQAYQVPVADWHFIQNKILAAAQQTGAPGYIVAEIWRGTASDLPEEIQREAYGTAQDPGLMSAFDFPVRYALMKVLATQEESTEQGASQQPASFLNGPEGFGSHAVYPDFAIPNLMIGNHDTVRFGNLLLRAHIAKPSDPTYWQLHRLAFAFLTAYSGPVTIYYGDEIGDFTPHFSEKITQNCLVQDRCDDHVARTDAKILGVTVQPHDLDPRAVALKNYVAQLMQLKSNHPALSRGMRAHLGSGLDYYVDLKTLKGEKIIFIMNTGQQPKNFIFRAAVLGLGTRVLKDLLTDQIFSQKGKNIYVTVLPLDSRFLLVS